MYLLEINNVSLFQKNKWQANNGFVSLAATHFGLVRQQTIGIRSGTIPGQESVDPAVSLIPGIELNSAGMIPGKLLSCVRQ